MSRSSAQSAQAFLRTAVTQRRPVDRSRKSCSASVVAYAAGSPSVTALSGSRIQHWTASAAAAVELANSWVDALRALIHVSLRILGTDEDAVANAFSWLSADKDPAPGEQTK